MAGINSVTLVGNLGLLTTMNGKAAAHNTVRNLVDHAK